MIVSGLTLTLISVERYKALVRALQKPSRLNKDNVVYVIAVIWVFAIAYVTPALRIYDIRREKKALRDIVAYLIDKCKRLLDCACCYSNNRFYNHDRVLF